ncbi:MAG: GNAT family N-acetyltransferase [Planctomycetota bacterium]
MTDLDLRVITHEDLPSREGLKALQRDIFGFDLTNWEARGYWGPEYVSFTFFEGERAVANVSTMKLSLFLEGKPVPACGILTVASRPEFRGQGLVRTLLEKAVPWSAERSDVLLLFAGEDSKGLYEKFGFRVHRETSFLGRIPPREKREGIRPMDLEDEGDRKRMEALVRNREPVSNRIGFGADVPLFQFNAMHYYKDRIHFIEPLDVSVLFDVQKETVKFIDVVGSPVPSFNEIVPFLPGDCDTVEFLFYPDKMDLDTAPRPLQAEEIFMVRGDFPLADQPFMIPYTGHF